MMMMMKMMPPGVVLLFAAMACCCCCSVVSGGSPLPPTNLLVEYLPSPVMGVDTLQPRFGWSLSHEDRGQSQTAYAIVVDGPGAVAWSSGKVACNDTQQIEFPDNTTLTSDTSYSWYVIWYDNNDVASDPSALAYFDTGLFDMSADWQASWISGGNDTQLRTEFNITKDVSRARLYICGLGYYVATMNGQRPDNHVLGTFTVFEERILYDTFDVTNLLGDNNALAVTLGNGWYAQSSVDVGPMSLLVQVSVTYTDGSSEVLALTGTGTWVTNPGPITFSDIYIGEVYDSRLETPGWQLPAFNSSGWSPATTPNPVPTGVLSAQMNYPITIDTIHSPVNISEPSPGVYVIDFGQNIAGWSSIRAIGDPGTTIKLIHSEMVYPNGTVQQMYGPGVPQTDTFIMAGTGEWESYQQTFTYHGFRYLQLEGYPMVPSPDNFQSYFIHTAIPETGQVYFGDSHPNNTSHTLNSVQQMTKMAALSNWYNIPTDCPQRERRGWLGDAQLSAETDIHNFDMPAAYTKFLRDIQDQQTYSAVNESVPDCVPYYNHGAIPSDPAWGTAYTFIWHWMYQYYGDTRILTTHYDGVKAYIDSLYLLTDTSTHSKIIYSLYGDWCSVAGGFERNCQYKSSVVETFYYVSQLDIFSEMAEVLGNTQDSVYYAKLAAYVRANWNENFYNAGNATYEQGYQTMQALPFILGGVVNASDAQAIKSVLLNDLKTQNDYHMTAGIVGTKYLLPLLTSPEFNEPQTALKIATQTTYPSWGYWLEQGATTLWENWQTSEYVTFGSKNHIMFGGHGNWYYQTLGGITMTPGSIAFRDITISPLIGGGDGGDGHPGNATGLHSVSCSINAPIGQIESTWYIIPNQQSTVMKVTIPVNSVGTVVIPSMSWGGVVVTEGSTVAWANGAYVPGVSGIVSANDTVPAVGGGPAVSFRVGSGNYTFTLSGNSSSTTVTDNINDHVVVRASAQEGQIVKITCPHPQHRILSIDHASYGSDSLTPVGGVSFIPGEAATPRKGCFYGSAQSVVAAECLHRSACALDVKANAFTIDVGNVCSGSHASAVLTVGVVCGL